MCVYPLRSLNLKKKLKGVFANTHVKMDELRSLENALAEKILPWDRFSAWVHGICVVTFDLEIGQAIESIYPAHVSLAEADKTNICYLAFPDSNSGVMGDSQFHFRIRLSPQTNKCRHGHMAKTRIHTEYNRRCPTTISYEPNYLFGFTYFRQVKDATIRRGYYQKSVILLTKLPLINLFGQATAAIARKFFEKGDVSLEVACHDIDTWSFPIPGRSLELPLMGHLLQVHLPSTSTRSVESGNETVTLAPNHGDLFLPNSTLSSDNCDLFTCLLPVIDQAHTLWELILTAEPLVVMASTPTICSATVQYLTSIIYPFPYCADYRPFYTIHDSDFKDITASNTSALPNILLGVTNPFFSKALNHWPHVVKLGSNCDPSLGVGGLQNQGNSANRSPSHNAASSKKVKNISKFKMDSKPGVYSTSKALLDKDKSMVKRVLKGVQLKRPNAVQSALIRRHFLELTSTFMIPLERYLTSLMPLAKNISPYRAAPKVKPFIIEDFLRSLESSGPHLTPMVKGDWESLYKRFFKSPNFVGWFNQRHREVSQKLQLLHMESLAESTIETWMAGKEEVQLVDMVLRIRAKLSDAISQNMPIPDIVKERLEKHVANIVRTLPSDLQDVLQKGTILNIDKNYNASSHSVSGRNSSERTIDILENSPDNAINGNNEVKDTRPANENDANASMSALHISESSDNQSAQVKETNLH